MTAAAQHEPAPPTGCWCCGRDFPDDELVRLGAHPEVGLCRGCAITVRRRALARHHQRHPSVAGRLRGLVDTVRNHVITRGWQQRGLLGALLRRIDRYLP